MDLEQYVESLRPALTEIASEQERAEADLEAVRQRVAAIKERRRRVERAMAELMAQPPRRQAKKSGKHYPPAQATLERVLQFVNENPKGVSGTDAKQGLSLSDSTVNRAFKALRTEGVIRYAGKRGMADIYKPLGVNNADPVATG